MVTTESKVYIELRLYIGLETFKMEMVTKKKMKI